MKNLFRININHVEGLGGETIYHEYMISESDTIRNDNQMTSEDVCDADVVYSTYHTYTNLGAISETEIDILKKFGIL